MADCLDPLALQQGANNLAAHRDTADLLDLTACNRLAVGDQRKGFEQCARVARRALLPQLADPTRQILPHLVAIAAGDTLEFVAATLAILGQIFQRLIDQAVGGHLQLVE